METPNTTSMLKSSPNREEQMLKVQREGFSLFQRKNKDYGDSFAKYGPVGVLMRMGDKISRLQSITKSGIVLVDDEKVRDTLIDLHNYAAMGIMLLDEGEELKIKENAREGLSESEDSEDSEDSEESEENGEENSIDELENLHKKIKLFETFMVSCLLFVSLFVSLFFIKN